MILKTKYSNLIALLIVILTLISPAGCNKNAETFDPEAPGSADNPAIPVSVILFIGDGMGEAHRQAATYWLGDTLVMDEMAVYGYSRTRSADSAVTDSAAAATAIATGVRTNNGVIGMDSSFNELTTILEEAQERGMSTGLITNVQIAHATPAAFAAHVENRNNMTQIAEQILDSGIDVILGGGENDFVPSTESGCFPGAGKRIDGRNLLDAAIGMGYTYVCEPGVLRDIDPSATLRLIGLFADEEIPRSVPPSLEEMTRTAIAILSKNPAGFFLMVEGGQIDWASHSNEAHNVIADVIRLDEAVAAAMDYAENNTETLIIVTADHETGGMSVDLNSRGLLDEDGPFSMPDGTPFYVNWSTSSHTDANVPTSSRGFPPDMLDGVYDNIYIYDVMMIALGE